MDFISNCIKGIFIGAGAIIPGISSGVLCVIFGIYEKLLNSVLGFFKNIKENIKFLFPIFIGAIIGILLFSNMLNYLLYKFPIQTKSIFIGLIIGTLPSLIKEINSKRAFKFNYIAFTLIALSIGIFTVILENNLCITSSTSINFFYLVVCGFIMSVGIIVPGVSSTVILMLLGVYSTYLTSVSNLYFPILLPMGIGLFFGCIICMKTTKFLLEHFYSQTFYTIIGFTIGSTFILLPELNWDIYTLISFLCILLGFNISNILTSTKNV